MRILILGGTGAMGMHLVQILAENSRNKIYVTTRQKKVSTQNITYLRGNAKSHDFFEQLTSEKWDVIIER